VALRLKTLLAGLLIIGGLCFTSATEFRGLWVDAFGAGAWLFTFGLSEAEPGW
jgi:hypothetical protein